MHICFVNMPIEFYSPVSGGAVSTVMMNYARCLEERGHQITVLSLTDGGAVYPVGEVVAIESGSREKLSFLRRRISGLQNKLQRWDNDYYEYYLRSYRNAIRNLKTPPDAIVVHNDLVSPRYLRQIAPKSKIVVWLHNEQRTRQKPSDLAESLRCIDHFIAVSDYIRDWTEKTYALADDKITTVLNGVDLEVFYPRADFLEETSPVRVLFVGRLDPNKGPDLVAQAVAQLRRENLPVTLTIAGAIWWYGFANQHQDPFFQKLKVQMDEAQAEYLGHVERAALPAVFRTHDVSCVLSRANDPCPLVTFESMASGCALLASSRGGIAQSCDGAALLVDPDDVDSVVSALRSLVENKKLLQTQKVKSVARAAQTTWRKNAGTVETVLTNNRMSKDSTLS